MEKLGRFMQTKPLPNDAHDKPRWQINSSAHVPLGRVAYYTGWRKWVFEPHSDTVYDSQCLRDIAGFLAERS